VTGVSGRRRQSHAERIETLFKTPRWKLTARASARTRGTIKGFEHLGQGIDIDQRAIGRTPGGPHAATYNRVLLPRSVTGSNGLPEAKTHAL